MNDVSLKLQKGIFTYKIDRKQRNLGMDETKKSFNVNYKRLEELFLEEIELIEKTINKSNFDKKLELLKEKIIKEYAKELLSEQIKSNDDNNDNSTIMNANNLDDLVKAIQNTDEQPRLSDEDRENISAYLTYRINAYTLFGSFKKMKLCQRFFSTKPNKSYENSRQVLEFIITNDNPKIRILTLDILFKRLKFEGLSKSLINDALKILRCHNLAKQLFNKKSKENSDTQIEDKPKESSIYYPTNEEWVKDARYKLQNREILTTLAKLLLSFVRANIDNKPSDFFETIDKLIEFILKRSILHNVNYELEAAIYTAVDSKKKIDVIIKATGKKIEIKPKDIIITFNQTTGKDSKDLIYLIAGTSQEKQISLSEITLYSSYDANNVAAPVKSNIATITNNLAIQDEIQSKKVETTNVILAVNYLLYEYFVNIDVFEEMEIITDLAYIETLQMEYINKNRAEFKKLILTHDSVTPSADFFLLKIKDEHDFIAQEIQKNLQYIKIIHPLSMYDTVKENMTVFLKNELL